MKTRISVSIVLTTLFAASTLHAELIKDFRRDGIPLTISPSLSEAWTSTGSAGVRATLTDNPVRMCYECRFWNYQTASPNLTSGLEITAGTDLYLDFFIYPQGHPLAIKTIYIYGTDVRNVNYDDVNNTLRLNMRPVAPTVSASLAGGYTAIAGIDFNYNNNAQTINYTPPIVWGDVIWTDISRSQHPSSRNLLGYAVRVNGVQGQPATLNYLLGTKYAAWRKYDLLQTRGYLDGETPASGFNYTLDDPTTPVTTTVANDTTFKRLNVVNQNFSARDIQAGVFLRFTNIVREGGGVRLNWNRQTTNLYTIQYFSNLGGPTNILSTNLPGPSFLDAQSVSNSARFYRLRAQ
jgi:hypothetical protein